MVDLAATHSFHQGLFHCLHTEELEGNIIQAPLVVEERQPEGWGGFQSVLLQVEQDTDLLEMLAVELVEVLH